MSHSIDIVATNLIKAGYSDFFLGKTIFVDEDKGSIKILYDVKAGPFLEKFEVLAVAERFIKDYAKKKCGGE